MKSISSKLSICILMVILFSGCAWVPIISPMREHFENTLLSFRVPEKETIKTSFLKRNYPYAYSSVFDSSLIILQQYAIITEISKKSGVIAYVDIDGISLEKKMVYWEFPFALLIEEASDGTTVYIYPMQDIFTTKGNIARKKCWRIVEEAFTQKGEEFLERLSVQLSAKNRWSWLTKN